MQRNFFLSQVYALLTIFFWSSAFVFTKVALEHYSFASLALLRCAIASLCLGGVLMVKRIPFPGVSSLPKFFVCGATGFALYILAFNKGSLSLNPTTSCILISTAPILTAFLAQLCFGEKLGFLRWLAIALAFCGILIMTLWDGVLLISEGIIWMMAAALLISLYNVLQRALASTFTPLLITAYSFFASTILLTPFTADAVAQVQSASAMHTGLLLFLGVCPSAAAYLFWAKALSLAPNTSNVTNYMFLTPFLALLMEYLVTGALPGIGTFVGGGVIMASLLVFLRAGRRH